MSSIGNTSGAPPPVPSAQRNPFCEKEFQRSERTLPSLLSAVAAESKHLASQPSPFSPTSVHLPNHQLPTTGFDSAKSVGAERNVSIARD